LWFRKYPSLIVLSDKFMVAVSLDYDVFWEIYDETDPIYQNIANNSNEFIVNTTSCQIPNLFAFDKQVLPYIQKKKNISCRRKEMDDNPIWSAVNGSTLYLINGLAG